jgi:integrase
VNTAKGRRANGETTIYQDARGAWHGVITVGRKPNGTLDRRHRRGKTRTEVVAKMRELERARDHGAVTAPGVRWTVGSWVEHYIESVKGDALAPRTASSYRSHLRQWIGPHIGSIPLAALQIEDVEKMLQAMRRERLSAATSQRVRATVRAALAVATRRNLIARNVAALAHLPYRDQTVDHAKPLTVVEARRVMELLDSRPDGARWALAMLGMRPGEVAGLDWATVDLEGAWLHVEQQLIRDYPYRHGCDPTDSLCRAQRAYRCPQRLGGRMLTQLKSSDSRRRLALPPQVVTLLRTHRAAWAHARILAGPTRQEKWGDLVFAQPDGSPIDDGSDRRAWIELLRSANVPGRRIYDARHTAGTLLIEEGATLHQAKDQLGHSQISVTSRYYLHATDRLAQDSASRLGGALFGTP